MGKISSCLPSPSPSPQGLDSRAAPIPPSASRVCLSLCVHLFCLWPSRFLFLALWFVSLFLSPASLSLFLLCAPFLCPFSVVPRKLSKPAQLPTPNTCHPSPTSPLHCPCPLVGGPASEEPPSLTFGGHAPPAAQRQAPGQRNPAHPRAPPRSRCQTFLRSCWARRGGGGRAGLSPALPPAPGSPIWHCLPGTAGVPWPALLAPPQPPPGSPGSLSPSRLRATLSPPRLPLCLRPPARRSRGATWTARG